MTDISALIAKASLLDERRKNGADAANGSLPGMGAFQQQFSQALGVSNSSNPAANGVAGTTASSATHKVGMAAPQSSVAAYQSAVNAQGSGAQALDDYMAMPLSDRMFFMILAGMGISKEQYDAMSPDEKSQLAAKVEDRIKQAAASPGASQPEADAAQGTRFAPVQEVRNAQNTRNDGGNQEALLQA